MDKISAIILAAGSGKRIGTSKLKLKIEGNSFISLIIFKLKFAGLSNILSVIREEDEGWYKKNIKDTPFLINKNPDSGMIHSIHLGVDYFKKSSGIIVFPVDHPLIKTDTLITMINAFKSSKTSVIKPYFNGKSGHPVIIPECMFSFIFSKSSTENLNNIIALSNLTVSKVKVSDEGVCKNINYITDLNS